MRIRKTYQGEIPENKIVNSYSESQTDTYSCDYLNPKLLWTNPNPTSEFAKNTIITLNSNDYDMYEIIFLTDTSYKLVEDTRCVKGYGVMLTLNIYSNKNRSAYSRDIIYINETTLKAGDCFGFNKDENFTDNTFCIPLYIIGYKTGLFNNIVATVSEEETE